MVNVIIVTQARIGSSRLPGKVLKKINDKSILEIHLERIKKSKYGKKLILATTNEEGVDGIIEIAKNLNVKYYQGNTDDVLDRFFQAAVDFDPDYVVRLTSDCPLIDPTLMDDIIEFAIRKKTDYTTNTLIEQYPDGQDVEVIKWTALKEAWKNSKIKFQREHVTPYIRENSSFFGIKKFTSINFCSEHDYGNVRMTVDELADFDSIKVLIDNLGFNSDWLSYTNFIIDNPNLFKNQQIIRNQGSNT